MSKKNKTSPAPAAVSGSHAAEYRIIGHDLIKVVILNAVYLIALLALYYTNHQIHYLERWFGHILHF